MLNNQEFINNQPNYSQPNTAQPDNNQLFNNLKLFLQTRKKTVLILLAGVLILESVLAIFWVKSTKGIPSLTISQVNKPKEHLASLSISPQNIQTKQGDQFTVKVFVDTQGRLVNGIDAIAVYDPKVLEVVDQPTSGDLFTSLLVNTVDPTRGQIILTGSRLSKQSQPLAGTGTLANISFVAKTSGTTNITILFDPTTTTTSNVVEAKTSNNILTDVNGATIQISK